MLFYDSLSTTLYFILIILFVVHFQQFHSLRCKCNANRGPSLCTGDFCDIHNRDGKRAACAALRRSRQTIFACVLIRRSSNDTYCHVIGSTTACWCRQMDFCNADLEAELFDVDDSSSMDDDSDNSDTVSLSSSRTVSDLQSRYFNVNSNQQLTSGQTNPDSAVTGDPGHRSTVSRKTTISPKIKQSIKINSAVPIDIVEKIELTPEREDSPTVLTEIISDTHEYELDEDDAGFQWQAIVIPDNQIPEINTTLSQPQSIYSPKHDNDKSSSGTVTSRTVSAGTALITKMMPQRTNTVTAVPDDVMPSLSESEPRKISISDIKVSSKTVPVQRISTVDTVPKTIATDAMPSHHTVSRTTTYIPNIPTQYTTLLDDKSRKQQSNAFLRPFIPPTTTTTATPISPSQSVAQTSRDEKNSAKTDSQTLRKVEEQEKEDGLHGRPDYIRLKMAGITPSIIYNQSAPKTRLDQWNWKAIQRQHSINDNHNNNNDNRNNRSIIFNNDTNKVQSSFLLSFISFSLLFLSS